MGGTDITDSVYDDGKITIPAVTDSVVITAYFEYADDAADGTLMYNWDLTNSWTDTVAQKTAVPATVSPELVSGEGTKFTAARSMLSFNSTLLWGTTIEVDFGEVDIQPDSTEYNIRTVMFGRTGVTSEDGFVFSKANGVWGIYAFAGGGWSKSSNTDVNAISNSTVRIVIDAEGIASAYLNGELLVSTTKAISSAGATHVNIELGSAAAENMGGVFYNAVVRALRIYKGVPTTE